MSFTLETTDMDLGDTAIENIFINDYMPMANGTYVKVYLLGFKYASDKDMNIEVDNKTIAKHLQLPLEDVLNAWNFWQDKGIIKKVPKEGKEHYDYDVKFLSLKQLYIRNNFSLLNEEKPKQEKSLSTNITPNDIIAINQNPSIRSMFNNIDHVVRRQLSPSEKGEILTWMQDYNMNPDMIEEAITYTVERKGKRRGFLNYSKGVIKNWYDGGIETMEEVLESYKIYDDRYYKYSRIFKALGLSPSAIPEEHRSYMDTWFDKFGFTLEIVLEACKRTINATKPTLGYVNGILENWHREGIKTLEDISISEEKHREKAGKRQEERASSTSSQRPRNVKTRFHNFEQRSDNYSADELEKIARKKREEYDRKIEEQNKKLRGEA